MDHVVSNITYGLIATSCTVLFVCGGLSLVFGTLGHFIVKTWQERCICFGHQVFGACAIAIALHFTL